MAKNWKVGEAVLAIKTGSTGDKLDIGRRFPLFAILAGQTNEAGYELLNCVPDHVTARKIESVLKGDVQPTSDEDTDEAEEAAEVVPAPKAAKAKPVAAKEVEEVEEVEEDEDEYAGKTAKQLYDLCKERGLKVEPKQKAEAYAKVLTKADAAKAAKAKPVAKAKAVEEEPWDDEEEAPKAKAKPAAKAKAKDEDEWDI